MASLSERKGIIHISYYKGGKHFRYSLKLKSTKEGYKEANAIKVQIEASIKQDRLKLLLFGIPEKEKKLSITSAKEILYTEKNIPEDDRGGYYSAIKQLTDCVGDINLTDLRPLHFIKLQDQLKLLKKSPNTIVTYFNYIRILLKHFEINGVVPIIKGLDKSPRIIPEGHLDVLFAYLKNTEMYYLIKFLYLTGCRISEALAVTINDINFDEHKLTIHNLKAKRTDFFPLYPELYALLKEYLETHKSEVLFKYHKRYVLATFRKATDKLELPSYTLHDIRRTFATKYASKLSPTELKVVMRHRNIDTTLKHYINHNLSQIAQKL